MRSSINVVMKQQRYGAINKSLWAYTSGQQACPRSILPAILPTSRPSILPSILPSCLPTSTLAYLPAGTQADSQANRSLR